MKLVKEHINEKFVENSDPIRDLGIGAISFEEKRDELIKISLSAWIHYLRSLMGKTIIGIFYGEGKTEIKFKITDFESYANGSRINFYDELSNRHRIMDDERYIII